MKVFFLGNCQINAMRGLFREHFPRLQADFLSITPHWGHFNAERAEELIAQADLVVAQAVTNPDTKFNAGEIEERSDYRAVFLPYVYLDGIAGLEMVSSKGQSLVRGGAELLDDWADERPIDIYTAYCEGRIDLKNEDRLARSFARIRAAEDAWCEVRISDYLEDRMNVAPLLYAINHPVQHVLHEMFRRLCRLLDLSPDPALFRDPVLFGRRALPPALRALSPMDVDRLGLGYAADPHWYGDGHKLMTLALKHLQMRGKAEAA